MSTEAPEKIDTLNISVTPSIDTSNGNTIELGNPVKVIYVEPQKSNADWVFLANDKNKLLPIDFTDTDTNATTITFESLPSTAVESLQGAAKEKDFNFPNVELLQSAVIIFQLPTWKTDRATQEKIDWRFHEEGILFGEATQSSSYNCTTKVVNFGKTLILTIDRVQVSHGQSSPLKAELEFRLAARALKKHSGKLTDFEVYISQDPRLEIDEAEH